MRNSGLTLRELRDLFSLDLGYLETTVGDLPTCLIEKPTRPASVIRWAKKEARYNPSQAHEMTVNYAIGQRAHARFYGRKQAKEAR